MAKPRPPSKRGKKDAGGGGGLLAAYIRKKKKRKTKLRLGTIAGNCTDLQNKFGKNKLRRTLLGELTGLLGGHLKPNPSPTPLRPSLPPSCRLFSPAAHLPRSPVLPGAHHQGRLGPLARARVLRVFELDPLPFPYVTPHMTDVCSPSSRSTASRGGGGTGAAGGGSAR